MPTNWEGQREFCMYLKFTIWKVTLFPGGKDTHRGHFGSLSFWASFSLSWENAFQMEVSTLRQLRRVCLTQRLLIQSGQGILTSLRWLVIPIKAIWTHCWPTPSIWLQGRHNLYLKSAGTSRKGGTFGHDRFKAQGSTCPSVSMVWIPLSIQ